MDARLATGVLFLLLPTISQGQDLIEYVGGMRLGQGYDLLNGKIRENDCVRPIAPKTKSYPGADSSFDYSESTNSDSQRRFFQIDAAASYNAATSSGSGRARFVQVQETNTSTAVFSFRHRVLISEYSADHWDNSGALKKASSEPLQFRMNCGTHYIKAIYSGGELYGTLIQAIKSEADRTAFSAAATESLASMKANLDVETRLEKTSYASTLQVRGAKVGGNEDLKLSARTMRQAFQDFRKEVSTQWRPIYVVLTEYPVPPLTLKSQALEDVTSLLLRYNDVVKSLDDIEQYPEKYYIDRNIDASVTSRIRGLIMSNRQKVISHMNECREANGKSEISKKCDFSKIRIAYPPLINPIAKLYRNHCTAINEIRDVTKGFEGLPYTSGGDTTMGGQDVVTIATHYFGEKNGSITRRVRVRVVETRGDLTEFSKSLDELVWTELDNPGCYLAAKFDLNEDEVGAPFPLQGNGTTSANNYMGITFPTSNLVSGAVCRSNQEGDDAGFAGCQSITFKPINLPLEHTELRTSNVLPQLTAPAWLLHPETVEPEMRLQSK